MNLESKPENQPVEPSIFRTKSSKGRVIVIPVQDASLDENGNPRKTVVPPIETPDQQEAFLASFREAAGTNKPNKKRRSYIH